MATLGFFIDTGGRPDNEEEEEEVGEVESEEAEAALGVEDVKTEAKLRQRASRERSLASFLFGKTSQPSSGGDESGQSESDQEEKDSEEEEEDQEEEDQEEEDQEDEQISSVQ